MASIVNLLISFARDFNSQLLGIRKPGSRVFIISKAIGLGSRYKMAATRRKGLMREMDPPVNEIPYRRKGLWKYAYPSSRIMEPTPSVVGTTSELSTSLNRSGFSKNAKGSCRRHLEGRINGATKGARLFNRKSWLTVCKQRQKVTLDEDIWRDTAA